MDLIVFYPWRHGFARAGCDRTRYLFGKTFSVGNPITYLGSVKRKNATLESDCDLARLTLDAAFRSNLQLWVPAAGIAAPGREVEPRTIN
jgi:hypothetical protein